MGRGGLAAMFAVGIATALFVPSASADPNADYAAVKADYQDDHDITSCRFTS